MNSIEERLDKIESMLAVLGQRETVREWYTIERFVVLVAKACFTVREWARHGRIQAAKRASGRGPHPEWVVGNAFCTAWADACRIDVIPIRAMRQEHL